MPYNHYLKYLITIGKEPKDIVMHMQRLGFDVERKKIDNLKKGMMLPKIFQKYAENKQVDEKYIVKYAKKFNIKAIWRYKLYGKPKGIEEMLELVKDKNARLIPVILTIKGDKLVHNSMRKLGYEYSSEAIDYLLHYFYDVEKMGLVGWKKYFQKNVPKAAGLLDQPLDYIRYKFGLSPKLEYNTILQDLMHLSYFKSKDNLSRDDKESISMAKKLADLSIKAGEKLEKYGGKDSDTFLDDVVFEFENAGIEIDAIEEIEDDEGTSLDMI